MYAVPKIRPVATDVAHGLYVSVSICMCWLRWKKRLNWSRFHLCQKNHILDEVKIRRTQSICSRKGWQIDAAAFCLTALETCYSPEAEHSFGRNMDTLYGAKTVFTRSAITLPKVNRFGWNLEHCSEHVVGGWPWQILDAIRAVATVWEATEILFFFVK